MTFASYSGQNAPVTAPMSMAASLVSRYSDRASGCREEWAQLDQARSTLLDPYFK